jgi:hypothetical protein
VRQFERDGEHIWLRQSATLTVNGQTRTLEIGVPLPLGATPDEIDVLLRQAAAGMDLLTRQLDTRVAALLDASAPAPAVEAAAVAPAPIAAPAAVAPAPIAAPAPERAPDLQGRESPPTPPARTEPAASARIAKSHTDATPPSARPSVPPATPVAPAAKPTPEPPAPEAPAARQRASEPPAPKPAARPEPKPAPEPPAPPATPLTIPEFVAAAQREFGLNPKQAMDRLGVKSLAGLNLNEALARLRRQAVRDGSPAPTESAPPPASARPTSAPASARVAEPAHYFEEEDGEYEVSFTADEDDELEDDFTAASQRTPLPLGITSDDDDLGYDDFDLDDVPDFGPPPSTAAHRAPARTPAVESREPPTTPARTPPLEGRELSAPLASGEQSHAMQLIGQMRGVRGGGVPTADIRRAYRNIVVQELGDVNARALVQGLWKISPEKLGAEQIEALVSWGKRDTFAEEVALVLAELRAVQAHAATAETSAADSDASAPPATTERKAPSARPRTTGRAQPSAPPNGD